MINEFSRNIPGYFDNADFGFYKFAFGLLPDIATIVEIGSFKGRSSSYMATLIANGDKKVKFYCVDTWEGSTEHKKGGPSEDADAVNGTLFDVFIENMKPVKGFYIPKKMTSIEAAATFKNKSFDMVFIDAEHTYEHVKQDIETWLPKLKKGGIISGHDFHHPPVKQAVADTIGYADMMGLCFYKRI